MNLNRKGRVSKVEVEDTKKGFIEIEGEIWKVESASALAVGQEVIVVEHSGLTLKVK